MGKHLEALRKLGLKDLRDKSLQKSICLTNQLAILLLVPLAFFQVTNLVFERYTHFALMGLLAVIMLVVPMLNNFGKYTFSRLLLGSGLNLLMLAIAILLKHIGKNEADLVTGISPRILLLCFAILPLLIFTKKEDKLAWGAFSLNAICVLFYDEIHYLAGLDIREMAYLSSKYDILRTVVSISFLTIALLVYFLQDNNHRFQLYIERQNEELTKLNKLKDQLFGVLSHDLRSPLNSLQGTIQLLNQGHLSQETTQKITLGINDRLETTLEAMDNLLNWTRNQMQGDAIQKDAVHCRELTAFAVKLLAPLAENKQIILRNEVAAEAFMSADREVVMMVLRNLLANAIKFTPKRGRVTISSEIHPKHISIHVSDTGVGMASEEREKLFKRNQLFSKEGTCSEKGSGIGLLLCYEFLLKSKGSIRVDSEPGKGSTFTFTLPRHIFQHESTAWVPAMP